MNMPIIAIVGRPNVGKSSLFNKILGRQEALAFPEPGVTRDRKYAETEWNGKKFIIVDTGGMEGEIEETKNEIINQAKIAVKEADLVIFVVDGRDGVTPLDRSLANYLRKENKPVLVVVNKIDNREQEQMIYAFYALGWEKIYHVSCAHGRNISDLLDDIVRLCPPAKKAGSGSSELKDNSIKIAIVGKPNVGKSSLVNNILGENRVIVDSVPGTTRDSIDTVFDYKNKKFVLIDTAGLRKKTKVLNELEKIMVWQTIKSISRCDIAILLIDAVEGVGMQDMKIADLIIQANKACIFVVNKWDMIDRDSREFKDYMKFIGERFPALAFAPVFFTSAKTGEGVKRVLEKIPQVYTNYSRKVSTNHLNKFIWDLKMEKSPPAMKGVPVKIKYITQVGVKPPVFSLTVKGLLMPNYLRFLKKGLYKDFDFSGSPLVVKFK
ncbi:MAG: ribosome biogenesis GTPase Der [bacterium]|nr:ribosome biogenesis GTPase Der [bacterium]